MFSCRQNEQRHITVQLARRDRLVLVTSSQPSNVQFVRLTTTAARREKTGVLGAVLGGGSHNLLDLLLAQKLVSVAASHINLIHCCPGNHSNTRIVLLQ